MSAKTATDRAKAAITALVAERGPAKTICPSEAARRLAEGGDWRAAMPGVHEAVAELVEEGAVTLSWKGADLERPKGPYRIGPA